jgi:uncharacterized protein
MTTIKLSEKVHFTPQEYAGQGNAILGIRDSGKSYTGTFFAEQILDAGIPFVAFDPIGVWRFLKTPGRGPGYPVVVAAPEGGDLPLSVASAPAIVRAAMKDNVPLVVDLYTMGLSKADWRRIVADCVSVLLYENKNCGLRHVFLEEAAEFCPQRVGPEYGMVYSVIEKLARMGGNASLGYTLINQRAEEVNKAVLENCDCLFLHRQKGKNSLMSLQKWIDFSAGGKTKEIVAALPGLPQGECFAWLPGTDSPEHVKIPQKRTFHPDRRKPELTAKAVSGKVDVSSFVGRLQKTLPKLAEEAAANDPKALKARIHQLEKELKQKNPSAITSEQLNAAHQKGFEDCQRRVLGHQKTALAQAQKLGSAATSLISLMAGGIDESPSNPVIAIQRKSPRPIVKNEPIAQQERSGVEKSSLSGLQRQILAVLAQYPPGRTINKMAVFSAKSVSSHFRNNVYALNSSGFVRKEGEVYIITSAGQQALGKFEELPLGPELAEWWKRKLSGLEARILDVLIEAYPSALALSVIAEACSCVVSSHFRNQVYHLSALELIEGGSGVYKGSPDLF